MRLGACSCGRAGIVIRIESDNSDGRVGSYSRTTIDAMRNDGYVMPSYVGDTLG
jgi:hypothetical protein